MPLVSAVGAWLSKGVYQTTWTQLATAGAALASVGRPLSGAGAYTTITALVSGTASSAGRGTLLLQGANGLVSSPGAWAKLHFVSGGVASFLASAARIGVLGERPNLIRPLINTSVSRSAKYKVVLISSLPFR